MRLPVPGRRRRWRALERASAVRRGLVGMLVLAALALVALVASCTRSILGRAQGHPAQPVGRPDAFGTVTPRQSATIAGLRVLPHAARRRAGRPGWRAAALAAVEPAICAGRQHLYAVHVVDARCAMRSRARLDAQPGGSSKLCLSCHDGTMAIGNVNVLNGQVGSTPGSVSIPMTGTGRGRHDARRCGGTANRIHSQSRRRPDQRPSDLARPSTRALAAARWRVASGRRHAALARRQRHGDRCARTSGYKPQLPLEPTGSGGDRPGAVCELP